MLAQRDVLHHAGAAHTLGFDHTLAAPANRAAAVRVIHQQQSVAREQFQVGFERRDRAVAREHAIREHDRSRAASAAFERARKIIRVAVFELQGRAVEERQRVLERNVGILINQRMGELPGE